MDIYEKLRLELNKMPLGFPKNSNGLDIKILKQLFSIEHANIALHLNIVPEPLEKIYKRISKKHDISFDELEEELDKIVKKGLILYSKKNNLKYYSYALLAIGMYEFQVNRMSPDLYRDCEQYLEETFAEEFFRAKSPQLRPVPISESVTSESCIAPYDDVYATVEKMSGDFAVANCICRQGKDLINEPCSVTDIRETCLVFPGAARNYFTMGIGRKIDKNEAISILKRAEADGLVLQMGNAQENPVAVCCCCSDCCGILVMAKKFSRPSEIVSSNYFAAVDNKLCKGCGKCIKRCHMDALSIKDGLLVIDKDRCIGCGVCIPVCSFKALALLKKNTVYVPPLRTGDYYKKLLMKKKGFFGSILLIIKLLFGKKV